MSLIFTFFLFIQQGRIEKTNRRKLHPTRHCTSLPLSLFLSLSLSYILYLNFLLKYCGDIGGGWWAYDGSFGRLLMSLRWACLSFRCCRTQPISITGIITRRCLSSGSLLCCSDYQRHWVRWQSRRIRYPEQFDIQMIANFQANLLKTDDKVRTHGGRKRVIKFCTCEQYLIKSNVHQIIAIHRTQYSGKKQLKYWFKNSSNGPINPASK